MIVFAIMAAGLYLQVVRPGILARRFVGAVSRSDFTSAEALMVPRDNTLEGRQLDSSITLDRVYAELSDATWRDLLLGRRHIRLQRAYSMRSGGAYVDWTEDVDVVATWRGVSEIRTPYSRTFQWPGRGRGAGQAIDKGVDGVWVERKLGAG
jgi:hypothetical protein